MGSGLPRKLDPETGKIKDFRGKDPDQRPDPGVSEEGFVRGPAEQLSERSRFYDQMGSVISKEMNRYGAGNPKAPDMVDVELGVITGQEKFLVKDKNTGKVVKEFDNRDDADAYVSDAAGKPEMVMDGDEIRPFDEELDADLIDDSLVTEKSGRRETARARRIQAGQQDSQLFELFQREGTAKGSAMVDEETGAAVIRAFEKGDLSTMVHELGHAFHIQMLARGNADEIAGLDKAFGIDSAGWNETSYEDFARSLEAFLRDPSSVPAERAAGMRTIAAQMRDIYKDIRGTALEGKLNGEQREFFESLDLRTDLPIQYAPGKFMQRADFRQVIASIRELDEAGEDWRTKLSPEDILATAKYKAKDGGPIRSLGFDIESEDDVLKQLAIFETLFRDLQREGLVSSKMTTDERSLRAMQVYNSTAGREMTEVLDDIMVADARNPGQGAVNVEASQMLMHQQLRKVLTLRDLIEADPSTINQARFHRALMQFQIVHSAAQQLRYQSGLDLAAWRTTFTMPTDKELAEAGAADVFIDTLGDNAKNTMDLVNAFKGVKSDDPEALARVGKMITANNSTKGGLTRSVLMETYINGLLSAPRTVIGLSLQSPLLSMGLDGASRFTGAMSQMDRDTMTEVLQNAGRNIANVAISARNAIKTLADEEPQLIKSNLRDDDMDPRAIRSRSLNPNMVDHAINGLGRIVRLPTAGIATFDEFYKQLNARTTIQARLFRDHRDAVLSEAVAAGRLAEDATPAQRRQYVSSRRTEIEKAVEAEFEDVIRDGRLRDRNAIMAEAMQDPTIKAMEDPREQIKAAREYVKNQFDARQQSLVEDADAGARRHVFQEELGDYGKKVQALLNTPVKGLPIGRIIMPFFRTPVNILKRFGEYFPLAMAEAMARKSVRFATGKGYNMGDLSSTWSLHTKTLTQLASNDPAVRAAAEGRMAMSAGLIASAYLLTEEGLITGAGPKNPDQRNAMRRGGWQPYSIRLGDTYYSYEKAEPFAFHLGMVADTMELLEAGAGEDEELGTFAALMYSSSKMLESKSYLQGISDLFNAFEQPERFGERYVRNLAGSAVPFSSFLRNYQGTVDPIIYENRDLLDAVRYNTSLGNEKLSPRYTVIGEPLTRVSNDTPGWIPWNNFINPVRVSSITKDPVYRFLAEMDDPIGTPERNHDGVDWSAFPAPEGPGTCFNYFEREVGRVEVEGMNLRQHLESFILPGGKNHNDFLKILGMPGTRPTAHSSIRRAFGTIISEYRDKARAQTLDLSPELRAATDQRMLEFLQDHRKEVERRGAKTERLEKAVDKLKGKLIGSP